MWCHRVGDGTCLTGLPLWRIFVVVAWWWNLLDWFAYVVVVVEPV